MSETKLTRYDINSEGIPENCAPLIVSDDGDYYFATDADARIRELEEACRVLGLSLARHRRFHGKVGCPDAMDCRVCGADMDVDAHPEASKYVKEQP